LILTIGHSTRTIEGFIELLRANGVRRLVDVRTIPRSRHNLRIPMMSISHSDLMPIRTERSDAGLSQCEIVIDIRQEFCLFSLS
jgi:hypothetical protein